MIKSRSAKNGEAFGDGEQRWRYLWNADPLEDIHRRIRRLEAAVFHLR